MTGMKKIRVLKHIPSNHPYTPADALEVETEVPEGTDSMQAFNQLNEETNRMIETWKTPFAAKSGKEPPAQVAPATPTPPTADELEKLPWKKNDYGEYVFSNVKGAEKLAEALKKSTGPLKIGEYSYSFGKDPKFINRKKTQSKSKA